MFCMPSHYQISNMAEFFARYYARDFSALLKEPTTTTGPTNYFKKPLKVIKNDRWPQTYLLTDIKAFFDYSHFDEGEHKKANDNNKNKHFVATHKAFFHQSPAVIRIIIILLAARMRHKDEKQRAIVFFSLLLLFF